jgi:hypothetical protein
VLAASKGEIESLLRELALPPPPFSVLIGHAASVRQAGQKMHKYALLTNTSVNKASFVDFASARPLPVLTGHVSSLPSY